MTAARRKPAKVSRRDEQRVLQQEKDLARAHARVAARRKNVFLTLGGTLLAIAALAGAVYYALHGTPSVTSTATATDLGAPTSTTPPVTADGFTKVSTSLYSSGKPVLLFIGAQFCPHCAAQRWSVIKALNQFGTFSNLKSSSASDANVPTFDLTQSTYTSPYVSFDHKDVQDRNHNPLQSLNNLEQSTFSKLDPTGGIPLVLAGSYDIVGDAYNVSDINGQLFSSVQHALQHNASSPVVTDINAEANTITAFLCHADGMKPSSVCGRSVVRSIVRTLR